MYDAVHVDAVIRDQLRDRRIPLAEPSAALIRVELKESSLPVWTHKNFGTPMARLKLKERLYFRDCLPTH